MGDFLESVNNFIGIGLFFLIIFIICSFSFVDYLLSLTYKDIILSLSFIVITLSLLIHYNYYKTDKYHLLLFFLSIFCLFGQLTILVYIIITKKGLIEMFYDRELGLMLGGIVFFIIFICCIIINIFICKDIVLSYKKLRFFIFLQNFIREKYLKKIDKMQKRININGLIKASLNKDEIIQIKAIKALKNIKHEKAINHLISLLTSSMHNNIKNRACKAILETGDITNINETIFIPALLKHKKQFSDNLIEIGKLSVHPLILNLQNKNPKVRKEIVYCLGKILEHGDYEVKSLISALYDDDIAVVTETIKSLSLIKDNLAIKPIMKKINDERELIRKEAFQALRQFDNDLARNVLANVNESDLTDAIAYLLILIDRPVSNNELFVKYILDDLRHENKSYRHYLHEKAKIVLKVVGDQNFDDQALLIAALISEWGPDVTSYGELSQQKFYGENLKGTTVEVWKKWGKINTI